MAYDAPPIVSPFFLQYERYPYTRGPNYVRPMFRENGPYGNFKASPISRVMNRPLYSAQYPLMGLGATLDYKKCVGDCAAKCEYAGAPGTEGNFACMDACIKECPGEGREGTTVNCSDLCKDQTPNSAGWWSCMSTCTGLDFKPPTPAPPKQAGFFDGITKDPLKLGVVAVVAALIVSQLAKPKPAPMPVRVAVRPKPRKRATRRRRR